jgi:plastocyanin
MKVTRLACCMITAALFACGGGGDDDGGTTGPPPPPPPPGTTQTLGSITTSVQTLTLTAGTSQTITVQAFDASGGLIAAAPSPTFASVNAAIAEVDNTGAVLGLGGGNTTVNVSLTMGSVTRTASVPVTVTGALSNQADVAASASDYIFTPQTVAIRVGGSVTWSFGALSHTVTFVSTAGAPASINETFSTSASRTFATAGNFTYNCSIHAGMSGKIIVR